MTTVWVVYRDDGEATIFYPEHFCATEETAQRLVEEEHRKRYAEWVENSTKFNEKKEKLLAEAQRISPDLTLEQVRQIGIAFGMVGQYSKFFVDIIPFEEWDKEQGQWYTRYKAEELE